MNALDVAARHLPPAPITRTAEDDWSATARELRAEVAELRATVRAQELSIRELVATLASLSIRIRLT